MHKFGVGWSIPDSKTDETFEDNINIDGTCGRCSWSVAKAANEKQNRHVKEQATLLTQEHSEEFWGTSTCLPIMLRTNWAPQCLKLPATIWTLPCVLVYLHLFSLQLSRHWVLVVLVKNACVMALSWCSSSSRVNNLVCTWWELTTRRNSSSSRVPDEFSMNERFLWHLIPAMSKRTCCSTSTLAHIPPAWVHGFTAPPASFETLKD